MPRPRKRERLPTREEQERTVLEDAGLQKHLNLQTLPLDWACVVSRVYAHAEQQAAEGLHIYPGAAFAIYDDEARLLCLAAQCLVDYLERDLANLVHSGDPVPRYEELMLTEHRSRLDMYAKLLLTALGEAVPEIGSDPVYREACEQLCIAGPAEPARARSLRLR